MKILDALFAKSCFIVATADIVATAVCQFQKDRVEQAWCNFLVQHFRDISTADMIAVKVCHLQKDRNAQAWWGNKFWFVSTYCVWVQGAAYSYAVFHHTVHIDMVRGAAYRNIVFHYIARMDLAKEAGYSNIIFHHTAQIDFAPEVA